MSLGDVSGQYRWPVSVAGNAGRYRRALSPGVVAGRYRWELSLIGFGRHPYADLVPCSEENVHGCEARCIYLSPRGYIPTPRPLGQMHKPTAGWNDRGGQIGD